MRPFRTTLEYDLEITGEHSGESKNTVNRANLRRAGYSEPISVFMLQDLTPEDALKTAAAHTIAAMIGSAGEANITTPAIYLHLNEEGKVDGYCTEALDFVGDHSENRSISASPTPSERSEASSSPSTSPLVGSAGSTGSSFSTFESPRTQSGVDLRSTMFTQNLIGAKLGFAGGIRVGLRDTDGNGNLLFSDDWTRIGQIDFEFAGGRKRDREHFDLLNFQSCRLKRLAFLLASPFLVSGNNQDLFDWMAHQGLSSFPTQIGKLFVARPELVQQYLVSFLQGIRRSVEVFKNENLEAVIIDSLGVREHINANPELLATLNAFIDGLRKHNEHLEALLTKLQYLSDEELETLGSYLEDYFTDQRELNRSIAVSREKAHEEADDPFSRWVCRAALEAAQTYSPVNAFSMGDNGACLFHTPPGTRRKVPKASHGFKKG